MAKPKRKKPAPIQVVEPTPEQFANGTFHRVNMAFRRKPVIDVLFDAGQLTYAQYSALAYYRNQATQAEDDMARAGTLAPERIMGGYHASNGTRLPVKFTPAISETSRIEAALGALRDIARAIAVEDLSLSQWCIAKHGGREKHDGRGFVAIVPNGKKAIETARLELRFAAGRITA